MLYNQQIDNSYLDLSNISSGLFTTLGFENAFDVNSLLRNSHSSSSLFVDRYTVPEGVNIVDSSNITNDSNSVQQYAYGNDDLIGASIAGEVDNYLHPNDFNTHSPIIHGNTDILGDDKELLSQIQQLLVSSQSNDGDITQTNSSQTETEAYEENVEILPMSDSTAQSKQFSEVYGYGVVDAAAAVAQALGQKRFASIPDEIGYYGWGLDAISMPEVWAQGYSGKNTVVAVIDTGVDYTHTDLDDNIWVNSGEVFGNGIDDDRNGYVDDAIGWDFVDNDYSPMDTQGHGTHVAGIIAAEKNGAGIQGVAYNAKIMPIRVMGDKGGSYKNIAQGILYAANNGADVINLSLGGGYSSEVEQAIQYATQQGAVVVMAAGNDSGEKPVYPAGLATKWGIAVGAMDSDWYMADFSNLAGSDPNLKYVVAPGVDIYSTFPDNNYEFQQGTSMAAPYVSGVAALMLSANPNLTPERVNQIIVQTSLG
ncbi:S8 family peptidase [Scytonema sp. NUACC21]